MVHMLHLVCSSPSSTIMAVSLQRKVFSERYSALSSLLLFVAAASSMVYIGVVKSYELAIHDEQ